MGNGKHYIDVKVNVFTLSYRKEKRQNPLSFSLWDLCYGLDPEKTEKWWFSSEGSFLGGFDKFIYSCLSFMNRPSL